MGNRPQFRVIAGGRCPPAMQAGVLRAMDTRLMAVVRELEVLAVAARDDLEDDDLAGAMASAIGGLHLVRLEIERRRVCRG